MGFFRPRKRRRVPKVGFSSVSPSLLSLPSSHPKKTKKIEKEEERKHNIRKGKKKKEKKTEKKNKNIRKTGAAR